MALFADVIVAPATPWGRSALAVVRLSGEGCHELVATFARPMADAPLQVGRPRRVQVHDAGGLVDDGVLVLGRAPHTATGEDTAELTLHGNPRIVERVVDVAVAAGARLAGPGAFTRRAVLNGKLDLVQAEGVLQAIEATSDRGLEVARGALDGRLGHAYAELRAPLVEVAAELEARLDHPGEEDAFEADAVLLSTLDDVAARTVALARSHPAGHALVHGARVALVGAVNAGKSSLFNALLGRDRAVVHATPGTTRDVVEAPTRLDGLEVVLLDTAGERPTDDPVEAAGQAVARSLTDEADLLLVVCRARPDGMDAVERAILERAADRRRLVVLNGVDAPGTTRPDGVLCTVATTGEGVDTLRRALREALVGEAPGDAALLVASARQRDLLAAVGRTLDEAREALGAQEDALAADAVTRAIETLDELTGADTREDVLDALFARFCIGK